MFSMRSGRSTHVVKLPNHSLVHGLILGTLGALVALGSTTRLYELREFFPLQLPRELNAYLLNYLPFILGTFLTTVAALAGLIVGVSWVVGGLREVSRPRILLRRAGDYYVPEGVSLGLKEGVIHSYDKSPSLVFWLLGKVWSNARFISEIPAEAVRQNVRFVWKALFLGIVVHFCFRALELLPPYLESWGLGAGYVIPSAVPFYGLLAIVCVIKLAIALSLIPLKRPSAAREMDSMIVEGKGHPAVFFAILEEGSKVFAHSASPNKISRSKIVACEDGETLIGTLIESFPEYIRSTCRTAAFISLLVGSVMVLVGFLQIILTQYPTFSVSYEDFFRLYLMSVLMDILLSVLLIILGKGFLEEARSLSSVYRFRSSLVYVEAKGDFEQKMLPDLGKIISPERLFNPLTACAFNVRYFSAEAISEALNPEGVRELVSLETSARLNKDVARLKYLPFQVTFRERYPSAWIRVEHEEADDGAENIIATAPDQVEIAPDASGEVAYVQGK
jgi:hypothetical protein